MKCLLIYDIPDDKTRTKIAEICLDYGLLRIQFSAFFGDMNHNHQEEIIQRIKRKLGKKAGNIQIFPICEKDLRLRKKIIRKKQETEKEDEG